jgi:hypothetical protein
MRLLSAFVLCLTSLGFACDGASDADADAPVADSPPPPDEVTVDGVPIRAAALQAYLIAGSYRSWTAESAVHSSAGPHGRVRTYVSPGLATSLAGAGEHPKGATAIKELYSGAAVSGWAVEIKVADRSDAGKGWFWYEVFSTQPNANPAAAGTGVGLCTGCHGQGGRDYVLVPFPLQ